MTDVGCDTCGLTIKGMNRAKAFGFEFRPCAKCPEFITLYYAATATPSDPEAA